MTGVGEGLRIMTRAAAAAALLLASTLGAAGQDRVVGGFVVRQDRDRFNERETVIALRIERSAAFGIRCLGGQLSFYLRTLARAGFAEDRDLFPVKLRADRRAVITSIGEPLDADSAHIAADHAMVEGLRGAREIALRVETARLSFDEVFKVSGIDRVIDLVLAACPKKMP